LIELNTDLNGIKIWIANHMKKTVTIGKSKGTLKKFIVEPFVPHSQVRV